jgi:cyanophycin synthetase
VSTATNHRSAANPNVRQSDLAILLIEGQDGAAAARAATSIMQIRKILSLVGPNVWANYPVLEAWVDLGAYDTQPSNTLPGFVDRLTAWLPSMIEHRCSEGVRGGFFMRLRDGTWLGHVLEHVTLELQTLAHLPVGYGRTRETAERGVYRVVVECHDPSFGEDCLRTGRDLVLAAIDDRPFDVQGQLHRLRELADKVCLGPSTQAIVSAAKARGIPHVRISHGNLVQLGYGKAQRRIWAAETTKTCALAESIAQDKELTRQLLYSVGVPMPAGRAAKDRNDAWVAAEELGLPVVVKPQDANHGRGVSIRLEDRQGVEAAFDIASREGTGVVVERFVSGAQYRVLVVGAEAVAASGGEAEQVVTDGTHTIEELVALANLDPRRGEDSAMPLTPLVLDDISLELLRRQGLDKTSVPAAGRTVIIHHNGDLTVDETDRMHPDVAASCVVAAQTVGLDVAGIDLIADDIGQPLEAQDGAIIEVNASPGLVMHLKPLVGKPRPVGEAIVSHLFPPGESGRVPLVAVSGTSGKTLVASLVASMLAAASRTVGEASSRGLRIGQRVLSSKDSADAASTRRVLVNPFVDAMVIETDAHKVVREGLAFDRCEVAVVTDLRSDLHYGDLHEKERILVAKAIRAPVDVVLPEGCAVLNADDPEVAAMAEKCRGRILYFSRDGQAPLMREHMDKGGQAVFLADHAIVANHMDKLVPTFEFDPSSALGRMPTPTLPLLAAVGAGLALGLTPHSIREGIEAALEVRAGSGPTI